MLDLHPHPKARLVWLSCGCQALCIMGSHSASSLLQKRKQQRITRHCALWTGKLSRSTVLLWLGSILTGHRHSHYGNGDEEQAHLDLCLLSSALPSMDLGCLRHIHFLAEFSIDPGSGEPSIRGPRRLHLGAGQVVGKGAPP